MNNSFPLARLEKFNHAIRLLLQPQSSEARSFMAFIRRLLNQFHLDGLYSDIDIFMDAYLRGVDHVSNPDKPDISNVYPWMRSTAYNVIRELSRECKQRPCEFSDAIEQHQQRQWKAEEYAALQNCLEERIQQLIQALSKLTDSEYRIIHLRVIEQLPWQDVQHRLVEEYGEAPSKLPALRQRGKRTLNQLREVFHELDASSEQA